MEKDFFVMLNTQNGGYTPLMDGDEIAKFETAREAHELTHEFTGGRIYRPSGGMTC